MKRISPLSKLYLFIVFLVMYAPILVLIFFSFNEGSSTSQFTGFSLRWYGALFQNHYVMDALYNTLILASLSAVISTVLGTAAAVGIGRLKRWQRTMVNTVTNIPMMNPDIVTGVSMLLLFVFAGTLLNIESVLGFWTLLIAHITFNLPYVILSVQPVLSKVDVHLSEAAQDLGCTPVRSFFKVVLPSISSGIITGFMMAFTLSVDDFVISFFTAGPSFTTLPLYIYSMTKKPVKPDINALSTIMFAVVLLLLILINLHEARGEKRDRAKKKGVRP
ncbi:MAG: ABC transporter permease [Clostridia bacterium]|nr:ABC transporter permease [Clostridia bacterium]